VHGCVFCDEEIEAAGGGMKRIIKSILLFPMMPLIWRQERKAKRLYRGDAAAQIQEEKSGYKSTCGCARRAQAMRKWKDS
jgi:hypothetical protein